MAQTTSQLEAVPDTNDPEVIRSRIEETRANMSETVDVIQARLSPDRLKYQAKEAVKGKVDEVTYSAKRKAKNWRAGVIETVRQNPIPSALIGIGLGWLMFSGTDDDDVYTYSPRQAGQRYGYEGSSRFYERTTDGEKSVVDRAQEKAGAVADQVREKAGATVDQVREKAGELTGRSEHKESEIRARAKDRTQHYTRRAKGSFQQMMEDNPLAVGAMAVAMGAAVGLALPTTRQEDEWLGETRDQLLEQAQTRVQETADKVKHVARETQETAKETARREAEKENLPAP